MRIDEFLEYGTEGSVKVKEYDYSNPDHVIISENDKPVFCIDTYTNPEMPNYKEIVYRKSFKGMKNKKALKDSIITRKRIMEKPGSVVIETNDNNGKILELQKITDIDGCYTDTVQDYRTNNFIMRVIRDGFELIKDRSEDRIVNEVTKTDGDHKVVKYFQQYNYNNTTTYQYIVIEYDNGEPVKVSHRLYDQKYKKIEERIMTDPLEISVLPWLHNDDKELVEEIDGVIVERRYSHKFSPSQTVLYFRDDQVVSSMSISPDEKIFNFNAKYSNKEFYVTRYIKTSDSLFEVELFRENENGDIELSVSMLVHGDVIANLVDSILVDQWEYYENGGM